MKKILIIGMTLFFLFLGLNNYIVQIIKATEAPEIDWIVSFNMDAGGGEQTTDGGYIVVGNSLIKLDSNGTQQWSTNYLGEEVHQTTDRGYIILVKYESNYELIKTDENGNKLWSKTINKNKNLNSIQQTNDNGYITTGRISAKEIILLKFDQYGDEQWNKTFLKGNMSESHSVKQTSDGGYVIAADTMYYGRDSYDIWLIKTDSNGNEIWDKTIGGTKYDRVSTIQQTADGGFIIAGTTSSYGLQGPTQWEYTFVSERDMWIVKTDSSGDEQWNKTIGQSQANEAGSDIKQTIDGGYIIVGDSSVWGHYSKILLVKTDSVGNIQWNTTTLINEMFESANSVQQTTDKGYFVTGATRFTEDADNREIWFIKISPESPRDDDIFWLSKAIMSEASIGSTEEQVAVGWCVMNRLHDGSFGNTMEAVVKNGFAWNQVPTQQIKNIAIEIIDGLKHDPTDGALYFFSPRSMPKEGENTQGYDVEGGLHIVPGTLYKVYFPSFAEPIIEINQNTTSYKTSGQLEWNELNEIRNWYFMFYHPISSQSEPGENDDLNDGTSSDTNKKTPGFELVFVLCAIAVLIILWKKKRSI